MASFTLIFVLIIGVFKLCAGTMECENSLFDIIRGFKEEHFHSGIQKPEYIIYLLNSYHSGQDKMNKRFHYIAGKLNFNVIPINIPFICTDEVKATKFIAKLFLNNIQVVNLKVRLPANYDGDDVKILGENLSIIGYSSDEPLENTPFPNPSLIRYEEVCKFSNQHLFEFNETYYETCSSAYEKHLYVTVISKNLEKYVLLVNRLKNIDNAEKLDYYQRDFDVSKKIKEPLRDRTILVCIDETRSCNAIDNKHSFRTGGDSVTILCVSGCESIDIFPEETLLAALLPKPLKREEKTFVPTIFYNTPYLLGEHSDAYPHGLVLYDNYTEIMTKALMRFIELQNWKRIAIVSDDSKYSDNFEAQIVELFKAKEVVYANEQCLGRVCDFNKALTSLREANARIIIANVEEKYAKDLLATAAGKGLTAANGVMWIWRNWPFKGDTVTRVLGEVFSLFLAGTSEFTDFANIKEGISRIKETHHGTNDEAENIAREMKRNGKESVRALARLHYREIEQILSTRSRTRAYIKNAGSKKIVFSYEAQRAARGNWQEVSAKKEDKSVNAYKDSPMNCDYRSYSFKDPCLDVYPLIIIFVVIGSLLAILGIILFLHYYNPKRRAHYKSL